MENIAAATAPAVTLVTGNDAGSRIHKAINGDTQCGHSFARTATPADIASRKMCFFCSTTPAPAPAQEEDVTVEFSETMATKIAARIGWFGALAATAPQTKVGAGTVRHITLSRSQARSVRHLLRSAEKGALKTSLGPARRIARTLRRVDAALEA